MLNLIADIGDDFFGGTNPLNKGAGGQPLGGVGSLVSLFINISFVIAGLILLFYFILGGIGMISSAGKSDPQKAEQAKKSITSALIGFIVIFTAYWVVALIGQIFRIDIIQGLFGK